MASSRAVDVGFALQRAKRKISSLQQQLSNKENCPESPDERHLSTWTPSKELRDSMVDIYRVNPSVNMELQQRFSSPARQLLRTSPAPVCSPDRSGTSVSLDHTDGPHESCRSDHDEGGTHRGPGSPALRRQEITADDCFQKDVSAGHQSLDQDKNISFLLRELDALRDVNQRLQEQLLQKETELQRRQEEEKLRDETMEARCWERPAAVLEEVLAAQKERDHALMSRLLLANEERDEALRRTQRLQQAAKFQNNDVDNTDMDLDELLQCVCDADSVQQVEHFGSVLVQCLRLARQRRNDITAQEMKAVMEERDASVAKCKHLEQDLIQEQEQRTTQEEMLRLQRERDGALSDRQRLEAELQALQAHCRDADSQVSPPEAPALLVQLRQLSQEKQTVESELQRCQEAERDAMERVRRLERLVEVLRKKVGTGNPRAVI